MEAPQSYPLLVKYIQIINFLTPDDESSTFTLILFLLEIWKPGLIVWVGKIRCISLGS